MSGQLSAAAAASVHRLAHELWQAARDPKLQRDMEALARWQLYAEQRLARVLEEEAARRAAGGPL